MRPPTHFALPNVAFANKMHTFLNHNKVWPSLEATLQETWKIL
jgi:hypothetical protein